MDRNTPRLPNWQSMPRDRKIKIVNRMAEDGLSSSEIAAEFYGASRNAVIGFCTRNEIPLAENPGGRPTHKDYVPPEAREQPERKPRVKRDKPGKLPSMPRAPLPTIAAPPITGGIRFLDVTNETCRWPLWDEFPADDEQARCCGEPTAEGSLWCEDHRQRATKKIGEAA